MFISLYKTLIRTHLDYPSSVWVPCKAKDIDVLQNVQRRCTYQLPQLKDLPYKDRVKMLKFHNIIKSKMERRFSSIV